MQKGLMKTIKYLCLKSQTYLQGATFNNVSKFSSIYVKEATNNLPLCPASLPFSFHAVKTYQLISNHGNQE